MYLLFTWRRTLWFWCGQHLLQERMEGVGSENRDFFRPWNGNEWRKGYPQRETLKFYYFYLQIEVSQHGSVLSLILAKPEDGGQYQCQVSVHTHMSGLWLPCLVPGQKYNYFGMFSKRSGPPPRHRMYFSTSQFLLEINDLSASLLTLLFRNQTFSWTSLSFCILSYKCKKNLQKKLLNPNAWHRRPTIFAEINLFWS